MVDVWDHSQKNHDVDILIITIIILCLALSLANDLIRRFLYKKRMCNMLESSAPFEMFNLEHVAEPSHGVLTMWVQMSVAMVRPKFFLKFE